jgi:hypothetical protein
MLFSSRYILRLTPLHTNGVAISLTPQLLKIMYGVVIVAIAFRNLISQMESFRIFASHSVESAVEMAPRATARNLKTVVPTIAQGVESWSS